ncbi:hypothetical protein MMC16_000147 [Acarospora aff. strigata]|nr:hypothetical protein [Acarospora aff. strigata]
MRVFILPIALLAILAHQATPVYSVPPPTDAVTPIVGGTCKLPKSANRLTSKLTARDYVRWATPLAPLVVLYIGQQRPGPAERLEYLINGAIFNLVSEMSRRDRTSPTGGLVGYQERVPGPGGILMFTACPLPDDQPLFTWRFASEVAVSLGEYYRVYGWHRLQFAAYRQEQMSERRIGFGVVDHQDALPPNVGLYA